MNRVISIWNENNHALVFISIFTIFVAHNIFWVLDDGLELIGDTPRYTTGAQNLIDGEPLHGKSKSYIGYSAFLAVTKIITPNQYDYLKVVIFLQMLVASVAFLCLYKIGQILYSSATALLTLAIYSINYIVIQWNHFIGTESLFTSMLLISAFLCIKTAQKPQYLILSLPVIIFTALVRPNGMVLLPVFLIYLFSVLIGNFSALEGKFKAVAVAVAMIIAAGSFLFVVDETRDIAKLENAVGLIEEGVVYQVDDNHYKKIEMPVLEKEYTGTLKYNLLYIAEYPLDSVKLAAERLFIFFSLIREDYSSRHNLLLYIVMPIYYIFALIGTIDGLKKKSHKKTLLILWLIIGQTAIVTATLANHDHRYFSYIVTFITLLFSHGVITTLNKFNYRRLLG